eukprot:8882286-Heterocapsa_arctica.AAC.1
MKPGYNWNGEYLVWSLSEMTKVDQRAEAEHFPRSVRTPHVTKVVRLPDGGALPFPMNDEWIRINLTLADQREAIIPELNPDDIF